MIVRCLTTELTGAQAVRLGGGFTAARAALLEVDRRYVAIGLQLEHASLLWGTGTWVLLGVGDDELLPAPLCLFEIVDGRVSPRWQARQWPDGSLTLWPASFYGDYYRHDLARREPRVLEDFRRVRGELEHEARDLGG